MSSRAKARRLIDEEAVLVEGIVATRPSQRLGTDDPIAVDPTVRVWVSRAAPKLVAGLQAFPVEVRGKRCIDIGSSTGGFTEVLLDRGASSVVALDVGNDQLDETIRFDPRVLVMEGTNIRHVDPRAIGAPFDLVVADLSFISLGLIAADLAGLVSADDDLLVLVKPQFEVQKKDLGKGGILRNDGKRRDAVAAVVGEFSRVGLGPQGIIQSPVEGSDGNIEFLLWCRVGATSSDLEVPA